MGSQTIFQAIRDVSNDYSLLEHAYNQQTGHSLVSDPFASAVAPHSRIDTTVSVIIAAWNARDTIERCLQSIEQSSFNQLYPQQLQVVVVDDGSTDSTWRILQDLQLDLRLIAVRQEHLSQPFAMNTGLSVAEGDIVISCDADMILTTFAIEELAKRHQVLGKALFIGFRYDVPSGDQSINKTRLRDGLPFLLPRFYLDNRVTYHWDGHPYPGWPDNMCRETRHLKTLGHGHKVYLPDGDFWSLPRMVYGALFSMRRSEWEQMGGFDERFYGWGWSDTFVGAKAVALGCPIVPVYSATGVHVAHRPRSMHHAREGSSNRHLYHRLLHTRIEHALNNQFDSARLRIKESVAISGYTNGGAVNPTASRLLVRELDRPESLGAYLYSLGRCEEAIAVYSAAFPAPPAKFRALYQVGRILRSLRRFPEAIQALQEASYALPDCGEPLTELALAQAGLGQFKTAKSTLESARLFDSARSLVDYILRTPAYRHLKRGLRYEAQRYYSLAIQDFEAALIQDSANMTALEARSRVLAQIGIVGSNA